MDVQLSVSFVFTCSKLRILLKFNIKNKHLFVVKPVETNYNSTLQR